MNKYDDEEKAIVDAYEHGSLKFAENEQALREKHLEAAEATFRKDARINIRLSSRDLRSLQAKALSEGIPYQTLVASILHKYVDGQLIDRSMEKNRR